MGSPVCAPGIAQALRRRPRRPIRTGAARPPRGQGQALVQHQPVERGHAEQHHRPRRGHRGNHALRGRPLRIEHHRGAQLQAGPQAVGLRVGEEEARARRQAILGVMPEPLARDALDLAREAVRIHHRGLAGARECTRGPACRGRPGAAPPGWPRTPLRRPSSTSTTLSRQGGGVSSGALGEDDGEARLVEDVSATRAPGSSVHRHRGAARQACRGRPPRSSPSGSSGDAVAALQAARAYATRRRRGRRGRAARRA